MFALAICFRASSLYQVEKRVLFQLFVCRIGLRVTQSHAANKKLGENIFFNMIQIAKSKRDVEKILHASNNCSFISIQKYVRG